MRLSTAVAQGLSHYLAHIGLRFDRSSIADRADQCQQTKTIEISNSKLKFFITACLATIRLTIHQYSGLINNLEVIDLICLICCRFFIVPSIYQ
jgi:hypothetical protein